MNKLSSEDWKKFRETGLLWWVNRILHTFGWAIMVEINKKGEVTNCYPRRVAFRGFDLKSEEEGYKKVTKFLKDNSKEIHKETIE